MKVENEIVRDAAFTEDFLPASAKIDNRKLELLEDAYRNLLEAIGEDVDRLRRYRDQGVARVVISLPAEPAEKTLPTLDRWAELIRRVAG